MRLEVNRKIYTVEPWPRPPALERNQLGKINCKNCGGPKYKNSVCPYCQS